MFDAAEIARLRESGNKTTRDLCDAIEQARKERDAAYPQMMAHAGLLKDMIAQRDAAQQSAKDARALAYEECAKVADDMDSFEGDAIASALRARIEAFLEPKV